jgi:DNA-binding FrmR family transcriptional regulator
MSDVQQSVVGQATGSALTEDTASPMQVGPVCDPRARPMMEPERQADVLLRLAKAAGQVQGISRMVSADRYCVDVLTQIAAAQKALDGVARVITRNYLERCVTDAINGGDPLIYDELMRVMDRRR